MKGIVIVIVLLALASCQDQLIVKAKEINRTAKDIENLNNFLKAIQEVLQRVQASLKIFFSFFDPFIRTVKMIKETFDYIFSVEHVITFLLLIIFLIYLMNQEQEKEGNYYNQREEQGEMIISTI